MIFKSLTRDGVAYEIVKYDSYRESGYYKCPGAYLAQELEEYLTYGDGLTKHAPSDIVRIEYFVDCLASLATYLQDNLEDVERISSIWPHQDWTDRIEFAMGIKYNPEKRQYVSMELQKISKSDKLRYDKRWEDIPSWADGSMEQTFRWVCESYYNAIYRFSLYEAVRKAYKWGVFEGAGIGSTENYNDLQDAFHAMDTLVQAYRMAEGAKRAYRRLKSNWIDRQKGQEEASLPLAEDLNALPVSADLEC